MTSSPMCILQLPESVDEPFHSTYSLSVSLWTVPDLLSDPPQRLTRFCAEASPHFPHYPSNHNSSWVKQKVSRQLTGSDPKSPTLKGKVASEHD